MKYTIHPAAACYPMIEGEAWEQFKADIELAGRNRNAIVINLVTDYLLDGRNRLKACQELGIEPKVKFIEMPPEDEIPYILSMNHQRRHMDKTQNAAIGAEIHILQHGTNRFQKKVDVIRMTSTPAISAQQIAKNLGVSRGAIQEAKKIAKTDPELHQARLQRGSAGSRELLAKRKAAQADPSAPPKPKVLVINPELSGKMRQWFVNLDTLIAMEQKTNLPIPLIDLKDLQVIETILPRIVAFIQEQKDAHLNDPRNRACEGNDRAILVPGSTDLH